MDAVYHQTGQIWALGQDKTPWGSLESLKGDSHEREKKKKRERSLGAKVSIDSCEGGGRRELVIFFLFPLHVCSGRKISQGGRLMSAQSRSISGSDRRQSSSV